LFLEADPLLKANPKSDGSGRRKRVSARHQVKRLDRISEAYALPKEEFALSKPVRQKNRFSSFGAGIFAPQFHRAQSPKVKSGPDVFADALVPIAAQLALGDLIFPNLFLTIRRRRPVRVRLALPRSARQTSRECGGRQ